MDVLCDMNNICISFYTMQQSFLLADSGGGYCYPVGMNRPNETLRRIQQRIRQMRLTQTALARYLGVSQASLSRRLSGQAPFTLAEMALLNSLLGLSGEENPAASLFTTALGALSAHDQREFLLLAASILEGKLQEPMKTQVCEALRILASGSTEN
jgi:transcriptional regulator with XRE-family HTH domain